jgi:hypothetical protein
METIIEVGGFFVWTAKNMLEDLSEASLRLEEKKRLSGDDDPEKIYLGVSSVRLNRSPSKNVPNNVLSGLRGDGNVFTVDWRPGQASLYLIKRDKVFVDLFSEVFGCRPSKISFCDFMSMHLYEWKREEPVVVSVPEEAGVTADAPKVFLREVEEIDGTEEISPVEQPLFLGSDERRVEISKDEEVLELEGMFEEDALEGGGMPDNDELPQVGVILNGNHEVEDVSCCDSGGRASFSPPQVPGGGITDSTGPASDKESLEESKKQAPSKKRKGRPKGSKNKPKIPVVAVQSSDGATEEACLSLESSDAIQDQGPAEIVAESSLAESDVDTGEEPSTVIKEIAQGDGINNGSGASEDVAAVLGGEKKDDLKARIKLFHAPEDLSVLQSDEDDAGSEAVLIFAAVINIPRKKGERRLLDDGDKSEVIEELLEAFRSAVAGTKKRGKKGADDSTSSAVA